MASKSIKIGIVSLSSGMLGDAVRIDQFRQNLMKLGFDVRVLNPYVELFPSKAGINNNQIRLTTLILNIWRIFSKIPAANNYFIERLGYDVLQKILSLKLYKLILEEKFDLLQAETFLAADVALPIKESLNVPMIFDLHSGLLTDEIKKSVKYSEEFLRYMRKKEKNLLYSSDHIIVTSRRMKERLHYQYGLKDLSLVPNGATPWLGKRAAYGSPLRVIYSGIFAYWERVHDYLDAAKILENRGFEFYLTGEGYLKGEILSKIIREKVPVKYLGCLPRDEFQKQMADMHIGVAPWTKDESFKYYSSTKTYEYLSMGMPAVCANAGEWSNAVLENECGIVVPPEDPLAIAEALLAYNDRQLWERHSANGYRFIADHWTWEKMIVNMKAIYEDIMYRRID